MSDNVSRKKKVVFKKLSIAKKLTIVCTLFSFLVFFIGSGIILLKQKKEIIKLSFSKLEVISNIKKQEIENYFLQLENHVKILSGYTLFLEAAKDLKPAFKTINSDMAVQLSQNEQENYKIDLKGYYSGTYLHVLNQKMMGEYSLEDIFPDEDRTILMQYLFIVTNPNGFENTKLYDKPLNSGNYGQLHFKYNPKIRELALKYNIDNVYLIDPETGYIFYSLSKTPDFATSLLSGPYRNSSLAKNYKEANKAELKNHVVINDMEFYGPTGLQPVMFISSPVFVDGVKTAILTFQIKAKSINNLLTSGLDSKKTGLGKTGEINIIGNDRLLRNDSRFIIENPSEFIDELKKDKIDNSTIEKIASNTSTVLLLTKDYLEHSYKPGLDNPKTIYSKYSNNRSHVIVQKLDIPNLSWNIATLKSKEESMEPVNKSRIQFFVIATGVLILAFVSYNLYSKHLLSRIMKMREAVKILSKGEKFVSFSDNGEDEISDAILALNQLNERIDNASNFTLNIGKGNFDMTFEPYSDKDMLGVSLNETKISLEKAKQKEQERAIEERKRNWTAEGIAIFSDLLRLNNNDISKLSAAIVDKIVEYLDASLAGIFLLDDEKNPPALELSGSYAFDRHKFLTKEIQMGEGLVGTCAREQKTILLKDVPDDYIQITSGFGETKPKAILLVPMIVEERVMGVIEIGSMKDFGEYQIEFVEKIGENIGSTLVSAKINEQTTRLLEESRIKSEEMTAQEEEMRQNLEELQATQEEMRRIKNEEAKKEEERRAKEAEVLAQLKNQNKKMKDNQERLETQTEELRAKETEMLKHIEDMKVAQESIEKDRKLLVTENKNAKVDYELIIKLFEKLAEKIPSFVFNFDANGNIIQFKGKVSDIINKGNNQSIFDVFGNIKNLLKDKKNQYQFDYSVSEGDVQWNFDVLILRNIGANNGFFGFGIEKDLSKYDAAMKTAIYSLLKTKDRLNNLRKGQ